MSDLPIPCSLIRGGSSRGAYFKKSDLPSDARLRDELLVKVMGGPDALQVDGIGGGHPLTSKVAIVSSASVDGADADYLFLQVDPVRQTVSDAQNCGNLLAGVGVYAIHKGMVEAGDDATIVRVHMVNSGALCHLVLRTPGGAIQVEGMRIVDGVPGTGAPIICNYLDIAGSVCGALLPTGRVADEVGGVEVTCVDYGMPVVLMRAADFGLDGNEHPDELDANEDLKQMLEYIRLQVGPRMNLGDVADKSVPKMCLVSPPRRGGLVATRTFIPHVCHKSIGVLGAVSVASACMMPRAVASDFVRIPDGNPKTLAIEHPSGALEVQMELGEKDEILKAGVVRTARLIFDGVVMA